MVYFGEDRARRITEKGTNYIKFLKSKHAEFTHKTFPESSYLIRKKLFGSKVKVLMKDGELIFWKPDINPSNKEVFATALPSNLKQDYMHRQQLTREKYANKKDNIVLLQMVGLGVIASMFIAGMFFFWQMYGLQTQALVGAVGEFADLVRDAGLVQTIPNAPR